MTKKASKTHRRKNANYDKYTNIFDLIPYNDANTSILSFMPLHINGKEHWRIVSGGETHLLYDVMSRNTGIREGTLHPEDPTTTPKPPTSQRRRAFLAYGVLIPQHGSENWSDETARGMLDHFKNTNLQTVQREGDKCVLDTFRYRDYVLDYTQLCKRGHIPCAFLMCSSMDYPGLMKTAQNDEDYLGIVMSPALPYLSAADNVLNRDFVIVIRDIEPDFSGHRLFWRRSIDKEKLKQTAKNLV